MSIQLHQGPQKDSDGNPIGTTPNEPPDGTVRLDVSLEGESVAVVAADATLNDKIRGLLEQLLAEARETNVHLRSMTGLEPDECDIREVAEK